MRRRQPVQREVCGEQQWRWCRQHSPQVEVIINEDVQCVPQVLLEQQFMLSIAIYRVNNCADLVL